jgi:hypothetical protein
VSTVERLETERNIIFNGVNQLKFLKSCPESGMVMETKGGGIQMSQKKISEILKLVEFLNEEVKEVSKRLSRVTPKEVSEKLGALALLREKILNLQVDIPQELEKKLSELYPSINKIKQKPS